LSGPRSGLGFGMAATTHLATTGLACSRVCGVRFGLIDPRSIWHSLLVRWSRPSIKSTVDPCGLLRSTQGRSDNRSLVRWGRPPIMSTVDPSGLIGSTQGRSDTRCSVRWVGRRSSRPSTQSDWLRSTVGRSDVVVIHPSRVYVGGIRSIKHHTRDLGGGAVDGKQSVGQASSLASRAGLRLPVYSAWHSQAGYPSTDGTLTMVGNWWTMDLPNIVIAIAIVSHAILCVPFWLKGSVSSNRRNFTHPPTPRKPWLARFAPLRTCGPQGGGFSVGRC
jgi:hypothetical protein